MEDRTTDDVFLADVWDYPPVPSLLASQALMDRYQGVTFKPGQIIDFPRGMGREIHAFPWRYRAHFEVDEPHG